MKYNVLFFMAVIMWAGAITDARAADYSGYPTINEHTTWTAAHGPYVIADDARVTFVASTTLTIEPGAIIKLGRNAQITVHGSVVAQGTAIAPISITTLDNDLIGGDTNGDGAATDPAANQTGVFVIAADPNPVVAIRPQLAMQYVNFSYLQRVELQSADGSIMHTAMIDSLYGFAMRDTALSINDLFLARLRYDALDLFDGSVVDMQNVRIEDALNNSLEVINSTAQIDGLYIDRINGTAIFVVDSTVNAEHVSVTNCQHYALQAFSISRAQGTWKEVNVQQCPVQYLAFINGAVTFEDATFTGPAQFGLTVSSDSPATTPAFNRATITAMTGYGLRLRDAGASVTDSAFVGNYKAIVDETDEVPGLAVHNTSFTNNIIGIEKATSVPAAQAAGNWWGDASGPYHASENPAGLGDSIEGMDVVFSPWLTVPPDAVVEEEIDPLLIQYAPVLYFHEDETYYPMNVEAFVDASALWDTHGLLPDTQVATSGELTFERFEEIVSEAGSDTTDSYYLAFSDPDTAKSINLATARAKYAELVASGAATSTVYVHKMEDATADGHEFIVLQYWFFYAMNNWEEVGGLNNHEGDWESVFVFLDKQTEQPEYVAFSSHLNDGFKEIYNFTQYDSVRRTWGGDDVMLDNDRLVSFVSQGSHANYGDTGSNGVKTVPFTISTSYQDKVSNSGLKISSAGVLKKFDGFFWSDLYRGLWGADSNISGNDGPQGPEFIDVTGQVRFFEPIAWAGLDDLKNITITQPTYTLATTSTGVSMQFADLLQSGTQFIIDTHNELITFGQNVGTIDFLPRFYDLESSLVNNTFNATVTLQYSQSVLDQLGMTDEFLTVYLYDPATDLWNPIQSWIDRAKQTVSFPTTHFSRYAIGSPKFVDITDSVEVKVRPGKYDQFTDTREMFIHVSSATADGVRVVLNDLPVGVVPQGATGITADGQPYLDISTNIKVSLIFNLPTVVRANGQANTKAGKENAKFKNFDFTVRIFTQY